MAAKQVDANTGIEIWKKGGSVVVMVRAVVSKDGRTLEIDEIGVNALAAQGRAYHYVSILNKQ